MGLILLPQRYLSQPQHHVEIAENYCDAELLALFNRPDFRDLAGRHVLLSGTASPQFIPGRHGRTRLYDSSTTSVITGASVVTGSRFTVFAWVRPYVLNSSYARVLETGYANWFYLGSNSASRYAFIVNNSALEGCVGGQQVVSQRDFVAGVFDGANTILYVNGREAGRGTATPPSSNNFIRIGLSNSGGTFGWNGEIDTVGIFRRAFSAEQMLSLYHDPYQLVRQQPRRLWFIPSEPSSDHNLSIDNAVQGNAASTGTINQTHVLSGAAATQANNAEADAISQTHTLLIADTTQANAASEGAIDQGDPLNVQSLTQSNAVQAAGITQTHSLSASNAIQANAAADQSITQTHSILIANALQNNAASTGEITQEVEHNLTISASIQANSADDAGITQTHVLVITASVQSNAGEAVSITQVHELDAGNWAQANLLDDASLSSDLQIDSPVQQNAFSSGNITVPQYLSAASWEQGNFLSSGALRADIIFEEALLTGQPRTVRVKKPGIPTDAPEWLRTMLETLTGRRNNKIDVPKEPDLTFSATPTKDECEKLFTYTNAVRSTLEKLINRMDT